jgi:dienelactone hydrolase
MPDLFNGDPVPSSAMGSIPSTFNFTAWSSIHTQEAVSAIVSSSIHSLRTQFGAKKIGAVGYCFGGKYVARFLVPGGDLDAGFTAHPSGVTAGEWANVTGPLSIAFGGK